MSVNNDLMNNYISIEQTAKLLDITVQTLNLWMKAKYGPKPIWIDKIVRFDKHEVEAFAKKLLLNDGANSPAKKGKQHIKGREHKPK